MTKQAEGTEGTLNSKYATSDSFIRTSPTEPDDALLFSEDVRVYHFEDFNKVLHVINKYMQEGRLYTGRELLKHIHTTYSPTMTSAKFNKMIKIMRYSHMIHAQIVGNNFLYWKVK